MRIVVDSNVWVSALVFGGNPRKVFESVLRDGHILVNSETVSSEVRRILYDKFPDFTQDFEDLLNVLESHMVYVRPGPLGIKASRDPDDDAVLETAVLGAADVLISGYKDLLVLKSYEKVKMISPTDFVKNAHA